MKYSLYLKSEHWKRKRIEAIKYMVHSRKNAEVPTQKCLSDLRKNKRHNNINEYYKYNKDDVNFKIEQDRKRNQEQIAKFERYRQESIKSF